LKPAPYACSASSVAAVRANQVPRGVSAAIACLPVTVTVTMPSRGRNNKPEFFKWQLDKRV
jgi:hypothetical protein